MVRISAMAHIAVVEHMETGRNFSMSQDPRIAMDGNQFAATSAQLPVAVILERARPQPATLFFHSAPEVTSRFVEMSAHSVNSNMWVM